MNRIQNIFQNSPNLVGQRQRHRRCFVQQRVMYPCPVVQIPPQPYRILQHLFQMRAAASTSYQASLLSSYCAVESFHMRSIDLATNAQLLNTLFDLFLFAKQSFARYLQQTAPVVSKFLHYSDLQIRSCFETSLLESSSVVFSTSMLYIPKYLQDSLWVWQMIVDQNQRRVFVFGIHSHRSGQLHGSFESSWTNDRFEQKPAFHSQSRMKPCFALFLLSRLRSFLGTLKRRHPKYLF